MRPGTLHLPALPPLSVYVHLPWCLKKCPYCDFNSHERRAGADAAAQEQRYVAALLADLEASLPLIWGRPVHSIFIGGGTPSLFSPEAIDQLIAGLRARLPLTPVCEITLEANPGTFERERFAAYRAAGVTRLSIGVQSFNDAHLKALGRVHDAAQARAAVEEAARAFGTFNLDLMYALPGQTLDELKAMGDLTPALRPMDALLGGYIRVDVRGQYEAKVRAGVPLRPEWTENYPDADGFFRVYVNGVFAGMGEKTETGEIRFRAMLLPPINETLPK